MVQGMYVREENVKFDDEDHNQRRIQEFQNGGGARSRRGRIFKPGICFDAPSHILYLFVARVVNKIHNINTVYLLKSKYMRVIQSNFYQKNP